MNLRFAVALVLSVSALSLDASAQRGRAGGYGGITVYEDPDFRGDSFTFRNEMPDLRQEGLNDRISSLEVDGNQAWEVCRDVNFGGGCRVFQGSIENLRSEGWNDRISSMRPAGYARNNNTGFGGIFGSRRGNTNNGQSRLVFYDRTNFRGPIDQQIVARHALEMMLFDFSKSLVARCSRRHHWWHEVEFRNLSDRSLLGDHHRPSGDWFRVGV